MSKSSTPIDTILDDIERALGAGLWYAALVVTLTVPEVCAALQDGSGQGGGSRYKAWYEAHLRAQYPDLTADDCYALRCGVIHQGRMGRRGMQYARVLFTVPNAQQNVFHNNILNDALNLDLSIFCRDMIEAARDWYAPRAGDPFVTRNAPSLIQYRPAGLAPYMVGMPLIT